MMAKLITETSYDFQIDESKARGVNIVGIFSSAGIKNNNGRIYEKKILEREVKKVQSKIDNKSLWGELGHPPNPEVNPDKIAILTSQLEWKNNDVYGQAKILDTPMGEITKTLVKEGNMGISSRGLGTVDNEGKVNEDYNLITWDMVTDPSNNPSWVKGIYEGKEFLTPEEEAKHQEKNIDEMVEWYQTHMMNLSKETIYKLYKSGKIDWPR